ncbi:BTB/POZ and MATH domain-containing protein 2-like [Triticum aestivum]|uniref:BTB/POZ and MATH domain-containing protein 2-like n=1 Tax=Triticum aestivum TaxID=4565 RepID=UPI00084508E9|nr:BTB/POZ and MATH domain-containing protein 2-like [Triticum aestivum]
MATANNSRAVVNNYGLRATSSRSSTESFTAAHDFEVASYPLLDGLGVGKYISSCVFSVGGYDWTIRFYPDGESDDCAGNTSAFLYCVSQLEGVRAKFTLNTLEKEGKVLATRYGLVNHTFSSPSYDFGYSKFVEKSRLLKSSSSKANNGYFIIRCVLTVIREPRTEVKRNLLVVPQPNLQDHLHQMWKEGQGADVTFSVSGQLFSAHRYLLAARSPVFKAELFGSMKESAVESIKIYDVEPPIFEALLHFMYTDSVQDDGDNKDETEKMQHLLVAADRYGLERLRIMCESRLCDSIGVETVATTLVLAEQHHCGDLKKACIEFMTSQNRLGNVVATDGFKHLMASCPLLTKDILDKVSCVLSEKSRLSRN